MAIFRLAPDKVKPAAISASVVFLACALFFFSPVRLPHKITLTLASAFIASLWLCPWQISMALLFSALGDYFGSCHNFMAQMGSFAMAHIWLIIFFAARYHRTRKNAAKGKRFAFGATFGSIALLAAAFVFIVPHAPEGILQTGVSIYACLICAMLLLALLQRDVY